MLIKCNECGHKVSDKADTCPNCNAKVTKVLNGFEYFFKNIIGFTIGYWGITTVLLMLFAKSSHNTIYYHIFGLNLDVTSMLVIALPLALVTVVLLAIKQHKKYKELKAKYGN